MIFPILLILIPRVLSMNPISALGHAALSKKYGLNKPQSATMIRAETPYASPPQAMDTHPTLCSPLPSCVNSPEWVANANYSDTPKSIDIKPSEENREASSSPVITFEECLREKANIDHVLAERAKLGPLLIESTERPVIDNMTTFNESVEAIRAKIQGVNKNHFYDNIDATIEQKYRCYGLNHMDVIAIRLYTTAMGFVVNEALRNYSLYDMPISTAFQPYIYALLNGLVKLDRVREINKACDSEFQPLKVVRYIPSQSPEKRNAIRLILDAHQPRAYVMYPAFTSSSVHDRAKYLYSNRFECRFEIQAITAILINSFSVYPNEFEAVFLPGTVFRILERDDPYIVMEEIVLQKLNARRAQLPC